MDSLGGVECCGSVYFSLWDCRINVDCVQFLRRSGSDPLLVCESMGAYDFLNFDDKQSSDVYGCQNIVLVSPILSGFFLHAKYSFDVINIPQNSILHPAVFVPVLPGAFGGVMNMHVN